MSTASVRVFSKASNPGQWAGLSAMLCMALMPVSTALAADSPSGSPVPRYAVLKSTPANARGGPGEDYKALWTYQARGAPVQIVEESGDWRRVCDPEGGLAWVHRRVLGPKRRVMRTADADLPMLRRPSDDAKASAILAAHATADLLGCRGGWCRISVDHATGWVRAGQVWGTANAVQCAIRQ